MIMPAKMIAAVMARERRYSEQKKNEERGVNGRKLSKRVLKPAASSCE
jgi:hypothetical protein